MISLFFSLLKFDIGIITVQRRKKFSVIMLVDRGKNVFIVFLFLFIFSSQSLNADASKYLKF
jgi:hypothetical protein